MSTSFRLTKTETEPISGNCSLPNDIFTEKRTKSAICVIRILFLAHHVHLKGACQYFCMLGIVGCRLLVVVRTCRGLAHHRHITVQPVEYWPSPILVCTNRSGVSLMSDLSERSPLGLLSTPSPDPWAHQQTYGHSLACSRCLHYPCAYFKPERLLLDPWRHERNNSYYFSPANQQKAGTKIYSLTQCGLTVNECDWHLLAGIDERINSHCLTRQKNCE